MLLDICYYPYLLKLYLLNMFLIASLCNFFSNLSQNLHILFIFSLELLEVWIFKMVTKPRNSLYKRIASKAFKLDKKTRIIFGLDLDVEELTRAL